MGGFTPVPSPPGEAKNGELAAIRTCGGDAAPRGNVDLGGGGDVGVATDEDEYEGCMFPWLPVVTSNFCGLKCVKQPPWKTESTLAVLGNP